MGADTSPTTPNREFSVAVALLVVLCIAHIFEPAGVLWCIGQVASVVWAQLHPASDPSKAAGTIVSVAAWQKSQATAMRPRARRRHVIDARMLAPGGKSVKRDAFE